MKKILIIIPNFGLGGAETMCENLINSFDLQQYELLIVSLYKEKTAITERIEKKGHKILYLNKHKGIDISMIFKLKKIINVFKPDVIHTHRHVLEYVVPAVKLSYFKKTKIVHTVHNIATKEVRKILQTLQKIWFRRNVVTPVAISDLVRDSIIKRYNIKNVPIVYNGIDLKNCIRKKDYKLKQQILHIGRFSEQKNHMEIIDIFEECLKKNKKLKLVLVGHGELYEDVERKIKSKNLEENVLLQGKLDHCYNIINESDIFILPSKWEGMPMTIIEAMGSGIPCIAYPVGGIPDMIEDGVNGFLPKTKDEFVKRIINLCEDEKLRRKIGENAIIKSKEFSSLEMCNKYCDIYFEKNIKK